MQFAMVVPFPYEWYSLATARKPSARGVPRQGASLAFSCPGYPPSVYPFRLSNGSLDRLLPLASASTQLHLPLAALGSGSRRLSIAEERHMRWRRKALQRKAFLAGTTTRAIGTGCSCNPQKAESPLAKSVGLCQWLNVNRKQASPSRFSAQMRSPSRDMISRAIASPKPVPCSAWAVSAL